MKTKGLILVSALFCCSTFLAGCNNHVHVYGELVAKVDAKCEEAGHEAYYHCVGCNKYFNENKEEKTLEQLAIAALGHDWVATNGKAATCTEDGWKNYFDCSRCDSYAETAEGEGKFTDLATWKSGAGKLAAGHTMTPQPGQEPTCLVAGWKSYYKCDECNKYYEDNLGTKEIPDLDAWKNGDGKVVSHVEELTLHSGTPAGCITDGIKDYYECTECDKLYENSDATGLIEDLDLWKATDGVLPKHVEELTLVAGTSKTCSTDGYKDAYKCAECGLYYTDADALNLIGNQEAYNAWILDGGKISASHKMVEHAATNPTGFKSGNTLYYECEDCDKFFADENGENEIQENSWVVAPLKTVTFDTAEQLAANTSKEGDELSIDKYGASVSEGYVTTIEPAGTFDGQQWNGYLMFPDLKGIKQLSIKGTGSIYFRTGLEAWAWNSALAHVTLNGDDTATVINLDPERDNSIIISSNGGKVLIKELSFVSALENGTGTTDKDLLEKVTVNEGSTTTCAYGYFTATDVNNSKSALVVGAFQNIESWPCVMLDLNELVDFGGLNLTFDAKGNGGRNRISVTPMKDGAPVGGEVGYDLSSSWTQCTYNGDLATGVANQLRITVFTTNVANVHENVIDNVKVSPIDYSVKETDAPAWSYRALGKHALLETDYANKAVAVDFKPETDSAALELDFMSDANTYVGMKNYLTVTEGNPSSTFGTITNKGDGWYTLTVSSYNICAKTRINNGNINGVYIATNDAMTGSVTIDYGSFRVVDDIAPTRSEVVVDAAHEGISIWGGSVIDSVEMENLKRSGSNELLVAVKVDGDVGTTVTMNFANQGGAVQRIFASITLTVTENGLSTNVGRLNKAIGDGWYNLIIKASELNQTELAAAENTSYATVFWCNNGSMSVRSITFDKNSLHCYAPGILA